MFVQQDHRQARGGLEASVPWVRIEAKEHAFLLGVKRPMSAIPASMTKQFSLIFQYFCPDLISFGRRGIMNLVFPGKTGEYDQL